jgi:flagella synthesis protein FlgN
VQPVVSLADLLADEIREVGGFIQLLREEQQLLASSGNADALLPLIERKSEFAQRLRSIADQRERLLSAQQLPAGRQGMEAYLAAQSGKKALHDQWRALLSLGKEARALNELNGKLINVHWQHNQNALAAMMAAADSAMVYGPDGQQTGGGGRRLLSSA